MNNKNFIISDWKNAENFQKATVFHEINDQRSLLIF